MILCTSVCELSQPTKDESLPFRLLGLLKSRPFDTEKQTNKKVSRTFNNHITQTKSKYSDYNNLSHEILASKRKGAGRPACASAHSDQCLSYLL